MRRSAHFRAVLGLALLMELGVPPRAAAPERVAWKPIAMAVLRVDDAPPKIWQIYCSGKRKHLLLVQMGARFLLLDLQARAVYELAARTLARQNDTLQWTEPAEPPAAAHPPAGDAREGDDSAKPDKLLLPSSGWSMRDVGPAMRIRFRLTDEGREFDVQFPIQPDLRKFY